MTVGHNTYLSPITAKKEGYKFINWTLNGEEFTFSGYVNNRINSDITLKANYEKYAEVLPNFSLQSSNMRIDSLGYAYIDGIIQNNRDKTWSYVQVTFNLFDKDGNQIGTALANLNNFQPNSTWKFSAFSATKNVTKYELAEIKGW